MSNPTPTTTEYADGYAVSSTCGKATLMYQATSSNDLPWVSYKNGCIGLRFDTLANGKKQLTRDGYRFSKKHK